MPGNTSSPSTVSTRSFNEVSNLVSARKNFEISRDDLRSFTLGFGQRRISENIRYGVESFTVTYRTRYKGQVIEASGLVFFPAGRTDPSPVLSLQHGTTFSKNDVPSTGGHMTGMELFAAAGFVTLMPDYIGYGMSSSVFHPYYDKEHAASTVMDMIAAVKELASQHRMKISNDVYLAGYSEGGYVTMATAEFIHNKRPEGIELKAVAAGAGGYDLVHMLNNIGASTYYAYPAYLAFVLMSYNTTYDWNRTLDDFFAPRYTRALMQYLDGKHDGWYINSQLSTNIRSLFTETFFKALSASSSEVQLKQSLEKNSVSPWKSSTPIRLYHGTNDEIIPLTNSEATLKSFEDLGHTNISIHRIHGGNHGSSLRPMMESFIPWFVEIAAGSK